MEFRMTMEWDAQCGILSSKIFSIIDGLKEGFRLKDYGTSISLISVIMICRGRDFKQRVRFKKAERMFTYDILLDYFLIKNVDMDQKKAIIRSQIIEITELTIAQYKFEDFNKAAFLSDMRKIVNKIEW